MKILTCGMPGNTGIRIALLDVCDIVWIPEDAGSPNLYAFDSVFL